MGCQKNSENYQRLLWMTPVSLLQHHRLKLERQECNCFSGVDFHEQNRTKSYKWGEIISGEVVRSILIFNHLCLNEKFIKPSTMAAQKVSLDN